jgi:hypothetical protein
MMILAPRRAGMTHAEFRRYLTEVHGPLVRSITEVAGEIRQYHYNFPVVGASDPFLGHPAAELDVITQGTFDSREAQLRNMQHPRFTSVLRPDEQNFADTARAVMHYTDQHEVLAGRDTELKVFYLRRRNDRLSRHEFQARWLDDAAACLVAALPPDSISRYVQNHVHAEAHHPDGANPRFYDVIDEIWIHGESLMGTRDAGSMMALRFLESETHDTSRTRAMVATMVPSIP